LGLSIRDDQSVHNLLSAVPGINGLTLKHPIIILLPLTILKGLVIMAEGILEIEDNSFEEEILKSEKPALVDFWAPWCGPCKAIGPIVEELSQNFGEKIKFAKCNVDNNPVTPSKYGIKAIPTLIFFKGGSVVEQITGMVAKSKLEEAINKVL
jgi:thioredoxin 1